MLNLIINADDFGFSKEINNAIELCFERGIINSATLMANMPGSIDAVERVRLSNFSVGIHLNLIEGLPICSDLLNDPLLSNDGLLQFNIPRMSVFLKKNTRDLIKKELEAQILFLKNNGIVITHIDSHQHTHTIFPIALIVFDLAKKYGLKVRIPRTTGNKNPIKVLYKKLLMNYMCLIDINLTEKFINYDEYNDNNLNHSLEVMVHPEIKGDKIICNTTGLIITRI